MRGAVGTHVHQKFGRAILGNAIVGARNLEPAPAAPDVQLDLIAAQRCGGRDAEPLLGCAERGERNCGIAQRPLVAVVKDPAKRVAFRRYRECTEGARPHYGLRVQRLAWTIDPALGEHRACHRSARRPPRSLNVEVPGTQVGIVLADPRQRAIVAESGDDVSLEPAVVSCFAVGRELRVEFRESRDPAVVRDGAGHLSTGEIQKAHARTGAWRAIFHPGNPHHARLRPDLRVYAEVGHLHHRDSGRRAFAAVGMRAFDLHRHERAVARSPGRHRGKLYSGDRRYIRSGTHRYPAHPRTGAYALPQIAQIPLRSAQEQSFQ